VNQSFYWEGQLHELTDDDHRIKNFYRDQDFSFQIALADAVRKGLENTPKCPSLDEILS
jgi:hypothetical protein